jgi:hypothetical protein
MSKIQSGGRDKNAAEPLGERKGVMSNKATEKAGDKSTRKAGPDGPSAASVGDTFKSGEGKPRSH